MDIHSEVAILVCLYFESYFYAITYCPMIQREKHDDLYLFPTHI